MDPRLRAILKILLSLAVEQEMEVMQQEPPEQEPQPAPGSLAYWLGQLEPHRRHLPWPPGIPNPQVTDFGGV